MSPYKMLNGTWIDLSAVQAIQPVLGAPSLAGFYSFSVVVAFQSSPLHFGVDGTDEMERPTSEQISDTEERHEALFGTSDPFYISDFLLVERVREDLLDAWKAQANRNKAQAEIERVEAAA